MDLQYPVGLQVCAILERMPLQRCKEPSLCASLSQTEEIEHGSCNKVRQAPPDDWWHVLTSPLS